MCLGMFCATVCALCVFAHLCLSICLSLDLSVWGSMLPLFGRMITIVCSLLKQLPCLCLDMVTLPPLTMQLQTTANKYTFMLYAFLPTLLACIPTYLDMHIVICFKSDLSYS